MSRPTPANSALQADLSLGSSRDLRYSRLIGVGLVAMVFVCFSPALSAEFVSWDDADNLLNNPHWRAFDSANLRWMFTAFHLGHYQPLTWISFAIDHALWGMDPSGYHFTNVIIHAANSVLLFVLSRRLLQTGLGAKGTAPTLAAGLAAALWAIHPLRVESVAWVTERRDVLSTFFLLLAALAYLRAVEPGSPRVSSWRAYWMATGFLALSCLSKAWGMSFFVLALVMDFCPLGRLPRSPLAWLSPPALRVLVEKGPMIAIGIVTAFLAAKAQQAGLASKSLADWPMESRAVQSSYGLWFYLKQSVAPSDLSPLYQLPLHMNPWEPRYVVAYAALLGALAAILCTWKKMPAIAAAAAVYAVLLAPVLGFFQSGEQFVADRYSYLATMPLSILLATGLVRLSQRLRLTEPSTSAGISHEHTAAPRAGLVIIAFGAISTISLGALTFAQAAIWHDTESLWAHAAAVTPSSEVFDYYGAELDRQGRKREAADMYRAAIAQDPADGRAWFCYANLMSAAGDLKEAEHAFSQAAPHMKLAYQAYLNLGNLLLNQGRKDEGIHQLELAVLDVETGGRRPLSGGPYLVLGMALADTPRASEVERLFRKAAKYPDTHADAAARLRAMGLSP